MKKLIFLLLFPFVLNAQPFDLSKQHCDKVLTSTITICYDYNMKGARYVAYTLDGNLVNKTNIKKRPRFYGDKRLPSKYRTYTSHYRHNMYRADRGHLAPDASFDYSTKSLHDVYTMANIIPQYFRVNRYTWAKAERLERQIAVTYKSAYVLNGVNYTDKNHKAIKRLRRGNAYPASYWKYIKGLNQTPVCYLFGNYRADYIHLKHYRKLSAYKVDCNTLIGGIKR